MDGARLDAMVAEIRARGLPIDSVTVVRHGHVVLDADLRPVRRGRARRALRVRVGSTSSSR